MKQYRQNCKNLNKKRINSSKCKSIKYRLNYRKQFKNNRLICKRDYKNNKKIMSKKLNKL